MGQELDRDVAAAIAEAERLIRFNPQKSAVGEAEKIFQSRREGFANYPRRFSDRATERLNICKYKIVEIKEVSVAQMLSRNYPVAIDPNLQANMYKELCRLPILREIAFPPNFPFILESRNQPWGVHLEMIGKYGAKVSRGIPDVKAVMGSITDLLCIWYESLRHEIDIFKHHRVWSKTPGQGSVYGMYLYAGEYDLNNKLVVGQLSGKERLENLLAFPILEPILR